MPTAALRKKIKALVDDEGDVTALRRIHDLLNDPALVGDEEQALKERLDRAEEDFAAGRIMNVDQVRQELKSSLEQHRIEERKKISRE